MKTTFTTLVFAIAATSCTSPLWAVYGYNVVAGHPTNTWSGASSDTTNGLRWSDANNWSLGVACGNGTNALFNLTSDMTVSLNATANRATAIMIAEGAGKVTITNNASSYYLNLRKNGDTYPNIINLSSNPIAIYSPVKFEYGTGTKVGVMPGVEFLNKVELTAASGNNSAVAQFNFYDGDTSKSDEMNLTRITGVFGATSTSTVTVPVYIMPNHNVLVDGESAVFNCTDLHLRSLLTVDGGTLAFTNMVLDSGKAVGSLALTNATVKTTDLCGTYTLTAATVNGYLTLDTTGGDLVLGSLTYGDDATSLTLTGGGSFAYASGVSHEFDSVTIDATETITLKSWPLVDGKKMVLSTGHTIGTTAGTYTIKILKSLGKTASDFTETVSGGVATITVTDDEDDSSLQVVTVSYPAYVTNTFTGTTDNDDHRMLLTTKWSDDKVAHGDTDYLVAASSSSVVAIRSSAQGSADVTFPGNSITLSGYSSSKLASLYHKSPTVEVTNLVMLASSEYQLAGHNGSNDTTTHKGRVHVFKGNIAILGPESLDDSTAARFYAGDSGRWMQVNGTMTGTGALKLYGNTSSKTNMGFDFTTCDASGFSGPIRVGASANDTMKISEQKNLGAASLVQLYNGGRLWCANTDSATFTNDLAISTSGTISNEVAVTLSGSITFAEESDTIAKAGAGSLIFANASISDFTDHLAVGTYAVAVTGGVELTNTEPATTGTEIAIPDSTETIVIVSTWLSAYSLTSKTAEELVEDRTDGNGYPYYACYALGLDPTDSTSVPSVTITTDESGNFVVSLTGATAASNVAIDLTLLSTTDLDTDFSEKSATGTGSGTAETFTITPSTVSNAEYFKIKIGISAASN